MKNMYYTALKAIWISCSNKAIVCVCAGVLVHIYVYFKLLMNYMLVLAFWDVSHLYN